MDQETKAQVTAVLDQLIGDKAEAAVREQLEPQIAAVLEPLQADIAAVREAFEKGPPVAGGPKVQPPPWNMSAQVAHALGIPDANWHNPDAAGANLDGRFSGFGDFLQAMIKRDIKGVADGRLQNVSTTGMKIGAELTGEELQLGGALVPEEFRPMLLTMMLQATSIRARATVLPMGSSSLTIPAIRDESHADGTVFGGVKFNWLEVNDEISETEPDFKLVNLNARALAGRTLIPNTLIEDSFITVPTLIMNLYQQAVPWIEESTFIRGDGVGKPLGILNSPARANITRNSANRFMVEDIGNMVSALPPGSRGRAVWMIHPQVEAQLFLLNSASVQSWHPALSETQPSTINGRPYIVNEHMSGLGSAGDVALVDWMYYLIGDRQALSMMASPHERFSRNQTVVRAVERLDGQPWLDTPIIPAQRTGTAFVMSPFVVLN